MAGGGDIGFYIGSYVDDATATAFLTSRGYTQARGYEYWDSANSQLKKWDGAAWGVITGAGATSPWRTTAGAIHPATPATDDVVVGASAMVGTERFRVAAASLMDKSDAVADPVLTVQASGSHPVAQPVLMIDQDLTTMTAAGLLIDSEVGASGAPLIELQPLLANTRGDIAFGSTRTAAPAGIATTGDFWYNSTVAAFQYYDGVAVQTISVGGTSPWSEAGAPSVLYPSTPATDDVVIGDNAMVGNERLLVINKDPASGSHIAAKAMIDTPGTTVTITAWDGFEADAQVDTGDTVTTARFFHVDQPAGGGTITTAYGLYIDDLNAGGPTITNPRGIYQVGNSDYNRFDGNTGFGTGASSSAQVVVEEDLNDGGSTEGILTTLAFNGGGTKPSWRGVRVEAGHLGSGVVTESVGYACSAPMGDSAGDITTYEAFQAYANPTAAGNVFGTYRAFRARASAGSGTVTNAYGLHVEDIGQNSTLVYGIRIDDLTGTTTHAIYQAGTDDYNRFEGNTGFGTGASSSAQVVVEEDLNDGGSTEAVLATLAFDGAGTKPSWRGVRVEAGHLGAGVVTDSVGFACSAPMGDPSGDITTYESFQAYANPTAAGNVFTTFKGFRVRASAGSGTITTGYGLHVEDIGRSSTTVYGVYIDDQTASTTYGIYQAGATDSNYLAGNVGVGAQPQSTDLVRAWEDSASSSAFHAEFDSAGSIANFYGFHSDIDVNSGHLLSLYHGVRIDLPTGSGSIDNAIGVMIRDLGNGPTINTESYALYIEDQSVNGSNTPYAIYQAGSDDVNYFAGQSEFAAITGVGGSPVSTAKLKVTDDSASGATLDVLEVEFNKTAAGVITAWRGVRLDPTVASGTVTTLTGVSIPAAQGAGTVTTYHGLEIFDLTSGPASGGTNYGIRQLGTSDKNRLEGQTGIGADYQADTQLFVDADYSGTIAATRNALRTQLDYTGSTTSLSDARVIHTDISAGSTATITNGYGLYVDSPTGAGTIAACTGIYIAAQETGPTTTGYGIWQNGSSDFNRFNGTTAFMGTVGLNDLTPNASYAMDAAGDINIQSGSVYRHNSLAGASGSFTTTDGKTVVVSGGIVTSIV